MSKRTNKPVLRRVAKITGRQPLVLQVNTFPPNKPGKVEVIFNSDIYPNDVSKVYVDIELLTNNDFYIHYVEDREGSHEECRWDRHDNDHNDRDHFHPFPDASTDDATDRPYPSDFFEVIRVVLDDIESRWGEVF